MKTITALFQYVENLLKEHFNSEDVYVPESAQELEKRNFDDDGFDIYLTTNDYSTPLDVVEVKISYNPKSPNSLRIIFPYYSIPRIFREKVYTTTTIELSDPECTEKVIKSCHEVIDKVRCLRGRHDKAKL
jgi:hypothetical protein